MALESPSSMPAWLPFPRHRHSCSNRPSSSITIQSPFCDSTEIIATNLNPKIENQINEYILILSLLRLFLFQVSSVTSTHTHTHTHTQQKSIDLNFLSNSMRFLLSWPSFQPKAVEKPWPMAARHWVSIYRKMAFKMLQCH